MRFSLNSLRMKYFTSLMSKKALKELDELSKEVEYVELADTKDYEKIFVKSMEFPI